MIDPSYTYILPLVVVIYLCTRFYQSHTIAVYAKEHNCEPLETLPYEWPLALDLIWACYQHAMEGRLLHLMNTVTSSMPPTFEQRLLGQSGINTLDPQNIEAILGTQFNVLLNVAFGMGDRPEVWKPLMGPGIFTQDGEAWKHSRNLLRPLFLSTRLDNFTEVREAAEALIQCIPADQIVDFQPLFFQFTLETTTYLLFGRSIRSLGDKAVEAEAFANAFRVSQEYLAYRGRLGPFHWVFDSNEFRDANSTVHKWIDGQIKVALESYRLKDKYPGADLTNEYGFLGSLMNDNHDPKFLRDALLNILLAGRDTTACLLTWTMRLLVQHGEVMCKLREEIESVVGAGINARIPDKHAVKKMKYLSYILKEVLRLYPSVPLNTRVAIKTTVLPTGGGPNGTAPVLVKKGTSVGYSVYCMHRRVELYGPDAEVFRPERWDPNETSNKINLKSTGWGYLPFNGGPRVCIGQEFALLEASYVIIRLLQAFKQFEYDPTKQLPVVGQERQDLTLVLMSADGCWVKATPY